MEIKVKTGDLLREPSDLAILAACEETRLTAELTGLFEAGDFRGRADQTLLLYPRTGQGPRRLLLTGLGQQDALDVAKVRQASAAALRKAREMQVADITVGALDDLPLDRGAAAQAFAEGLELGAYQFTRYRTGLTDEQSFRVERAVLFTRTDDESIRRAVSDGQKIARGVILARELVNGPGYAMTPAALGEAAQSLGKECGFKVTVLDKAQLTEQGFGGILAVGKGSENEPRFIVMEYGRANGTPTICLVGKGLTFDSGGLSLKPPDAMETMKSDMAGAAAVYGAMQAAAELELPLHIVGLVSAAENMPSPGAYRPGDVVTTLSGKTVEVLNTDAEGRIILSDALYYAQRYKPAAIVELSTLTGAIIIALGSHAIGMMGTDQNLADRITRAGEESGERVWQLPLWDEYREMIKSEIADIKNMAGRPAGSITAGAFLAEFTGDYPFVHLDIAGTAWVSKPTKPYEIHGGTGVGVRLLSSFLRYYAAQPV